MNVRWTPEATARLEQISEHIAQDNPDAALRTVQDIFERIEGLAAFPYSGRPGRESGTRELVLAPLPYIAVYRVLESTVKFSLSGMVHRIAASSTTTTQDLP
jgi:toxin ParE1/3/4